MKTSKKGATAKFLALLASLSMIMIGLVGVAFASPASATKESPDHKIMICHKTDAFNNPYQTPDVDMSSIDEANNWDWNGHAGGDHLGPVFDPNTMNQHSEWGDIIPEFWYTFEEDGEEITVHFPGYNWTDAGKAIYNNGCKPVEETRIVWWCADDTAHDGKQTKDDGVWTPNYNDGVYQETELTDADCSTPEPPVTWYKCDANAEGGVATTQQTWVDGAYSPTDETLEGEGWSKTAPTSCGDNPPPPVTWYICDANAEGGIGTTQQTWVDGAYSPTDETLESEGWSKTAPTSCGDNPPPPPVNFTATAEASEEICFNDETVTVSAKGNGNGDSQGAANANANSALVYNMNVAKTQYPGATAGACAPVAAAVVQPGVVAPATVPVKKPAKAVLPAQVEGGVAEVPTSATLPAAVPAGEGSTGTPMWAILLMVAGALGALATGGRILASRK